MPATTDISITKYQQLVDDNARLRQELAEFDEKMECGHKRRFIISGGGGEDFCASCFFLWLLAEARAENERLREMVEPRTGYIAALSGRLSAALQERFHTLRGESIEYMPTDEDQEGDREE